MPSAALQSITTSVSEVQDLLSALLTAGPVRMRLKRARVIGRAGVVLLSSHFERYFYTVNEEAVAYLNAQGVRSNALPEGLRLLHSAEPIDRMLETQWQNRAAQLTAFVRDESWLWAPGQTGTIRAERLLAWMKSPKPAELVRYYRYWGIPDIFAHVTRSANTRGRMHLLVSELVDKRNNIAHGDAAEQATRVDILRYSKTVLTFCARSDRALGLAIANRFGVGRPW
jgi:hypothetical protein